MIGGVTRHMLPQLPGVPHLHVNRPLRAEITLISATFFGWKALPSADFFSQKWTFRTTFSYLPISLSLLTLSK